MEEMANADECNDNNENVNSCTQEVDSSLPRDEPLEDNGVDELQSDYSQPFQWEEKSLDGADEDDMCNTWSKCFETVEPFVDKLQEALNDPENVAEILNQLNRPTSEPAIYEELRCYVMERVPFMATLLADSPTNKGQLRSLIPSHLMPLVLACFTHSSIKVVSSGEDALLFMIGSSLITPEYVEKEVWPILKQTMNRSTGVDVPIRIIRLMGKMAKWLGCRATEGLLVPTLEEMSSSPHVAVKRVCASLYGDFCAVISPQAIEDVLEPAFFRLCADEDWLVRKTCAEIFMAVTCSPRSISKREKRKRLHAVVFGRLLSDHIRWVELAAFKSLGPFITTFAEPSLTSLAYNTSGDLVLRHSEGFEFNINAHKMDESRFYPRDNAQEMQEMLMGDGPVDLIPIPPRFPGTSLGYSELLDNKSEKEEEGVDWWSPFGKLEESRETDNYLNKNSIIPLPPQPNSDESDSHSYNSFQFWREPLPEIQFDLNCNESLPPVPDFDEQSSPSSPDLHDVQEISNNNEFESCTVQYNAILTLDHDITRVPVDDNRLARLASHLRLPPVDNRSDPVVPKKLIEDFVSMSEPGRGGTNELAGYCAYTLPAVALTLGPDHWHLIKPAYESLAKSTEWKVRRTVASSIHELALIVGEEMATKDLLPVFNEILKDLDDVRIAALKHLAHFLKLLRPSGRLWILPRITNFLVTDYKWNWRFRQELAHQLLEVLGLFSPADTCHHLSPVVMTLLLDRASDVRKAALSLITELVSHVAIDVPRLRSLLAELAKQFAHSARWNRRQTFALFCSRLVSEAVLSGDMFARDVLPHLLDLSWDRVANVRLTVARALAVGVMSQPYFSDVNSPHYDVLNFVLKRLQGDKDRDVRHFALLAPLVPSPPPSVTNSSPRAPSSCSLDADNISLTDTGETPLEDA